MPGRDRNGAVTAQAILRATLRLLAGAARTLLITHVKGGSRRLIDLRHGVVVVGFSVMVKSRRASVRQALLTGTPLNAPLPFVAVQALVLAAASGHETNKAASATVAGLGAVSIASGFFDGGYAAEGYKLSLAERGIQGVIVAATAVTMIAAATQAIRARAIE